MMEAAQSSSCPACPVIVHRSLLNSELYNSLIRAKPEYKTRGKISVPAAEYAELRFLLQFQLAFPLIAVCSLFL